MDLGSESRGFSMIPIVVGGIWKNTSFLKLQMKFNIMGATTHSQRCDALILHTWFTEACNIRTVTQCDVYNRMNVIYQTTNKVLEPRT